MRALRTPAVGANRLVLVGRDKAFLDRVMKLLAKKDPGGELARSITTRIAADVLETAGA